ncbi:MAG TPA: HigA family addiction module antitoxin [Beijerinckiaceae bacterium]|jgi:addiction module HigA family antidote|nr:higA [Microvirga sp.]HZB39291.1 HigA family addiction module antitoxin [Beijerinckiaceae bacterium]
MAGNPLLKGLAPMHPGEFLRDITLPALDLPKAEIARRLGISRQTLYDILDQKQPVTPAMALRLGKFFGNGPDFWLNLQREYELRTLEPKMAEELAAIEPVAA